MFAFLALALLAHAFGINGHHLGYPPAPRIDPNMNWRIVGGQDASPNQFPYIVSLRNAAGNHNCGGSILDGDWVLTAAHCVVNANPALISAVAGSITLNAGGVWLSVSSIIVHAGYNPSTIENDIALLNIATDIPFGIGIASIPLGTEVIGAIPVQLSGWGTTSFPGSIPNNLQWINLLTITHAQCASVWGANSVFTSNLCTLTQAGEGACHGDSGGPLTANGQQVGIVSWGNPCANGLPDVFTRVSSFVSWVESNKSS